MYGICIELKTSCKHCSSPLMLNAFTEDFLCNSCEQMNHFSMEQWKNLLEDSLKEVHKFNIGEGQPSTVMSGEYNYHMLIGRQDPRCGKCKQDIDLSKIEEYSSQHHVKCSKCSNSIYVRKPSDAITGILPRVKYLTGEDDDLISSVPSGNKAETEKLPQSNKPILFTCPSCAGSLEIDGSERIVTCKFCNSQIYLPDDLWFRLHPAETVQRWYVLYDDVSVQYSGNVPVEERKLPKWYYLSDITIDSEGNLYAASTENSDDDFIVWSVSPDLKTRWIKDGLKFNNDTTGLTVTNDGNLYLWDKKKHSLWELSSKNGDVLRKIEGKPVSRDNPYAFNLQGCNSLVSCPDGTILALVNNTLARFNSEGTRVKLWNGLKFGFISSGLGRKIPGDDSEYAPYLKSVFSCPKRIDSDFTRLNMGWDGYLYMIDKSSYDGVVAMYDNNGKKLKSHTIPLKYKECKACADKQGNIYVLGTVEDSLSRLIKITPGGRAVVLLTDILEGGVLNQEDQLAVSPGGTIYVMKFYDKLKVFTPDLKMIYISDQCKEDDAERLKDKRDAIAKDEDF